MAPKLPERYETQVRLGRDGDVEEWLATDASLDRPVLVRILESTADTDRREDYIAGVRAAAIAHHVSLAEVYSVGSLENPYAVLEWHGGVSLADRLRAGETLAVQDFLAGGSQLASGLAALHASGSIHGAVDTAAIGFAGNHSAKLGSFGRRARYEHTSEDTAALASALRIAISGIDIPGIRPSEVVEGLPHDVDAILAAAENKTLSAEALAASLRALPPTEMKEQRSSWSWRWTGISAVLIGAALALSAAGIAIDVDPASPFLFPAVPAENGLPTPVIAPPPSPPQSRALIAEATGFDPLGGAFPNADDLVLIVDEARTTAWETDTYFAAFGNARPGIGVVFSVSGTPRWIEIVATPGTKYQIMWAESLSNDLVAWQPLWSGTLLDGPNLARVPQRNGGRWLLWLTGLPATDDGRYSADVAAVRFLP